MSTAETTVLRSGMQEDGQEASQMVPVLYMVGAGRGGCTACSCASQAFGSAAPSPL